MDKFYLGVDIGSLYTKFVVINSNDDIQYKNVIKTLSREKGEHKGIIDKIYTNFNIEQTCATGYGRHHLVDADIIKTEIHCASVGVTFFSAEKKNIIDIGGEDIKVIESAPDGKVIDFSMNTKCAAGTGAFITEIADRAEIDVAEMSTLASRSDSTRELNSYCTVFAKTEIMRWMFEDVPVEEIARGIYISVAKRISNLRMKRGLPIFLIGGVVGYHSYLKKVMEEIYQEDIHIPENPQYITAFGSALMAKGRN